MVPVSFWFIALDADALPPTLQRQIEAALPPPGAGDGVWAWSVMSPGDVDALSASLGALGVPEERLAVGVYDGLPLLEPVPPIRLVGALELLLTERGAWVRRSRG